MLRSVGEIDRTEDVFEVGHRYTAFTHQNEQVMCPRLLPEARRSNQRTPLARRRVRSMTMSCGRPLSLPSAIMVLESLRTFFETEQHAPRHEESGWLDRIGDQ